MKFFGAKRDGCADTAVNKQTATHPNTVLSFGARMGRVLSIFRHYGDNWFKDAD
jgi:hypothetical protein